MFASSHETPHTWKFRSSSSTTVPDMGISLCADDCAVGWPDDKGTGCELKEIKSGVGSGVDQRSNTERTR